MAEEIYFLDYHLKTLKFLVKYGGISLESRRRKLSDKIKDRFIFVMNFLWLDVDVVGAIFWFTEGLKNGESIVGLSRIAPCMVFSSVANIKGFFYIRHEDEVSDLIDNLKKLEKQVNVTLKNSEEKKILRDETKFLAIIIKTLNIINVILLITFALSPLVLIAYIYVNTKKLDLILPFLVSYPFDSKDIRFWPFAYLHQIWSECVGVLNVCVSDYFFYISCTFIKIQFRLLQRRLENVVSGDSSQSSLLQMEQKLIEFIKWHQELIRVSDTLEIIYTEATIYNFLCSSMMICLTGFSVMATDDVAYGITFLVFLSSNLLQIFLLCLFGDMVMRSSAKIGDAVYKSKWYQINPVISKKLLLIQTRAQKPCKLTASGFADVNLPAFTKILSTAWSYFALLRTAYNSART